jgi:hypothetical protein
MSMAEYVDPEKLKMGVICLRIDYVHCRICGQITPEFRTLGGTCAGCREDAREKSHEV